MGIQKDIIVMKFGGASVASCAHFAQIADLILKKTFTNKALVVVVSAMGKTTDELLSLAQKVHPSPPTREQDMLVSVGERISIALLAMALSLKNVEAISFTGSQSGVITSSCHCDARIVAMRPHRILKQLGAGKVVIAAGFQGMSLEGEITTLGRGGSDTSAVALAAALHAEKVEFYKDVPGVFDRDPKQSKEARLLPSLTFEEMLALAAGGAKVLHHRAVMLARKNQIPLHVLPFEDPESSGTWIGERGEKRVEAQFEDSL